MNDIEKAWIYLRKSKYNDIMDAEELKEVLYLCGKDVTDKQIKTIMRNEGGIITYDRLVELDGEIKPISQDDIMRAFKTFDSNGDNFISLTELRVLLQRLGERMSTTEIDKIFDSLDVNKDGKLDYTEFTGLYANTAKQLSHLLSVRVPGDKPTKETKPAVTSSVTVTESETETETETETEDDDDDDDIVVVPVKQATKSSAYNYTSKKSAIETKKGDTKSTLKPKTEDERDDKKPKAEEKKGEKKVEKSKKDPESKLGSDKKKLEKKSEESKKDTTVKSKDKTALKSTNKSTKSSAKSSKVPKGQVPALQHHRNVRGCTYAGQRGDWTAHQYRLTIPQKTRVVMLLSPLAQTLDDKLLPDLTLYLVKTDDHAVTHMSLELAENNRVALEGDLEAGTYTVLTHTTSCNFVNESSLPVTPVPVKTGTGKLSAAATKVLNDIFHCLDLKGDMLLSRSEFELFHIASSGEPLSDSMWAVIRDNFDLKEDSVTLEGFMKLHEMALEDEEGGEEEIRETLTSMGYNEALLLVKAVPWHIDVYTDSPALDLTVQSIVALTANQVLERAVVRCLEKYGSAVQEIEDKCKLLYHTLPWKSTAAIQNMTDKPLRIEVNTVGSENCLENPPYRKHILTVAPNKTMICHHFSPELRSKTFKPAIKIRIVPPVKAK